MRAGNEEGPRPAGQPPHHPYDATMSEQSSILAVAVGNTRTRFGVFSGNELQGSTSVANASVDEVVKALQQSELPGERSAIVIASVNDPVALAIEAGLDNGPLGRVESYRFGRDLPIPIVNTLEDDSTVGQDRLLVALGAYARASQACVVVDAGTAITVDFVDGEGVFQGGAILPGLQMMLDAMASRTAALPALKFQPPSPEEPFGKDTRRAMLLGVASAARGAVMVLLERYAEAYEAYPQVIATGGDAAALFEGDGIVEHIAPDLQLVGIREACRRVLET